MANGKPAQARVGRSVTGDVRVDGDPQRAAADPERMRLAALDGDEGEAVDDAGAGGAPRGRGLAVKRLDPQGDLALDVLYPAVGQDDAEMVVAAAVDEGDQVEARLPGLRPLEDLGQQTGVKEARVGAGLQVRAAGGKQARRNEKREPRPGCIVDHRPPRLLPHPALVREVRQQAQQQRWLSRRNG